MKQILLDGTMKIFLLTGCQLKMLRSWWEELNYYTWSCKIDCYRLTHTHKKLVLYVGPPVHPSVCLCICLFVCLSICLSIHSFVCLLCSRIFDWLSADWPAGRHVCMPAWLSDLPSACMPAFLPVCMLDHSLTLLFIHLACSSHSHLLHIFLGLI